MADNTVLDAGAGGDTIATDDIAGVKHQRVKIEYGVDGAATDVSDTNPLPVDDAGGSLTVDNAALSVTGGGAEASALRVTIASDSTGVVSVDDNGATISVDDGAGSLTVDNATLSVTGGGVEASALRVTLASDSTGVVSVDDNGGNLSIDDGGNSITVDNGGTFAVQATLAAGATTIAKAEDAAHVTGDVGVPALSVRQDTAAALAGTDGDYQPVITDASGRLHVNVGNTVTVGSHAVTNAGTFATQVDGAALTALQLIDNPVLADDAAFTLASSSVSMAGAIRDDSLSALTAVEGDAVPLRVNSTGALHVTGGGGGTQYAVDDVAGGTDTGTLLLAVRDDSLATLTPADGDYTSLRVSSTGALHVTGGGGGTEYTVDAAAPAAPTGATFVMERDDALSALTEIEGDWTNPRSSANGAMWVAVDGTVTVGSHAVTNAGTFAVQVDGAALTALQLIDDPVATLGTTTYTEATTKGMIVGAVRRDADTTLVDTTNEVGPLQMDANGRLKVEAFSGETLPVSLASVPSHAVTNAGTFAVQAGQVADDAAQSGNPVIVAGVAVETDGTDPTTVSAEGDAAFLRTDRARRLLVSEHHPRSFFTSADYASAQTNASIQAAPGAGLSLYITDIVISNGATAGNITLLDGSGGTVKFEIYPAINGGVSISLRNPIRLTANTALVITSTTVTTHSVNIGGYTAP